MGLPSTVVKELLVDPDGHIWVGTADGVSRYNKSTDEWTPYRDPFESGTNVSALLVDNSGNIWVGTVASGVGYFNGRSWEIFTQEDGLASDAISFLFKDQQGNIWAGMQDKGVSQYDSKERSWHTYSVEDGLGNASVTVIEQESNGRILIGTEHGINTYDGARARWQAVSIQDGPRGNDIRAILPLSDTLVVGSTTAVSSYNYQQDKWQSLIDAERLERREITAFARDQDGVFWIGVAGGGIRRLPVGVTDTVTETNDIIIDQVDSLLRDSHDRMWAGGADGVLHSFDGTSHEQHRLQTAPENNLVRDIKVEDNGKLWVATDNGLLYYEENSWRRFTAPQPLLSNDVRSLLLDDKDDYLWVATSGGVNRYSLRDRSWRRYDAQDGLPSIAVTKIYRDDNWGILASTANELLRYDQRNGRWLPFLPKSVLGEAEITFVKPSSPEESSTWVGTSSGLRRLSTLGGSWQTFTTTLGLTDTRTSVILQSVDGATWVGTDGGVSRFDPLRNTWQPFTYTLGLNSSTVKALIQSSDGTIWVGTDGGVSRFDPLSNTWQPFTSTLGLPSTSITTLFESKDGALWAGTSSGVSRYEPSDGSWLPFTSATGLPGNSVTAMVQASDASMWLGTERGLARYDGSTWTRQPRDKVQALLETQDGAIWAGTALGGVQVFNGTSWQIFTVKDGLPSSNVRVLVAYDNGVMVGTDNGLAFYANKTQSWETWQNPNEETPFYIRALLRVSDDSLLVAADKGFLRYDGENWEKYSTIGGYTDSIVYSMVEDPQGNIWFATSNGLWQYTGFPSSISVSETKTYFAPVWQTVNYNSNPIGDEVAVMSRDAEGDLWYASADGDISYFDGADWKQFEQGSLPEYRQVLAFLQDQSGDLWAGTDGGGLFHHDGTAWKQVDSSEVSFQRVTALIEDSDGAIWAGGNNTLSRYLRATNTWEKFTSIPGWQDFGVTSMAAEKDGPVWVGTNRGISRFSEGAWQTFTATLGLPSLYVSTLLRADDGTIWAGTPSGVTSYDGTSDSWTPYTSTLGLNLANSGVKTLLEGDDRSIWVGAEEGVSHFDGQNWQPYTATLGLAFKSVTSLAKTGDGSIWVGTYDNSGYNGGVSRFDGRSWQPYTTTIGLPYADVTALVADSSNLWVGTTKGVSRLDLTTQKWQPYSTELHPTDYGIYTLRAGDRNNVWAITNRGDIFQYRNGAWQERFTDFGRPTALLFAKDNTLWVGTKGQGVRRYVGKEWETFASESVEGLVSVTALLEDRSERVWVGTTKGVYRYDKVARAWTSFTREVGRLDRRVRALVEDPAGNIWVATGDGVSRYSDRAGGWRTYTEVQGLNSRNVRALLLDAAGTIWAATSSGVSYYESSEDSWTSYTVGSTEADNDIYALLQDRIGVIWAAGRNARAYRFNGMDWQLVPTLTGINNNPVLQLLQDSSGIVWGVGKDLVWRYEGLRWEALGNLNLWRVSGILEDKSGTIWVGGRAGLTRYNRKTWQTFRAEVTSTDMIVTDILQDLQSTIWIGTNNSGVMIYDGATWDIHTTVDGLSSNTTTGLIADGIGDIWVGTNLGLNRYSRKDNHWLIYSVRDGLTGNMVQSMLLDKRSGTLFVGTNNGLSKYDNGAFTPVADFTGKSVRLMVQDQACTIWVVTQEGAYTLDGMSAQPVTEHDNFFAGVVTTAFKDQNGSLWFGSRNAGVLRRKTDGTWESFTTETGLVGNFVQHIRQDEEGKLWFFSDKGVSLYDVEHAYWLPLESTALPDKNIRLQTLLQDHNGLLWFGTDRGVFQYRPAAPRFDGPMFTSIRIDGLERDIGEHQVEVEADHKGFQFTFRGGEHSSDAQDLTFFYRLRPAQSDHQVPWVPLIKRYGEGIFTVDYLPQQPGSYIFEVQILSANGNISSRLASPMIVVKAPPLLSPISLVLGVVAGLAVAIPLSLLGYRQYNARRKAQRRFNPYIAGDPIVDARSFYGRDAAIATVVDSIVNNHVLIFGDRRIGKTSLLYQIRNQLLRVNHSDKHYHFLPVYITLQTTDSVRFFWTMIDRIVRAAGLPNDNFLFEQIREGYTNSNAEDDLAEIVSQLQTSVSPRALRIILLIDEMDIFDHYAPGIHEQFRALLQDATFSEAIKVVAAGVAISMQTQRHTSPWYNLFSKPLELRELEPDEAYQLVTEQVRDVYDWSPVALQRVVELSHSKPRDLQKLCREAIDLMLNAKKRTVLQEHVEEAFERIVHERDEGYSDAWRSLNDAQRQVILAAHADNGMIPAKGYRGGEASFTRAQLYQFTYIDGTNPDIMHLTLAFRRWLELHHAL